MPADISRSWLRIGKFMEIDVPAACYFLRSMSMNLPGADPSQSDHLQCHPSRPTLALCPGPLHGQPTVRHRNGQGHLRGNHQVGQSHLYIRLHTYIELYRYIYNIILYYTILYYIKIILSCSIIYRIIYYIIHYIYIILYFIIM